VHGRGVSGTLVRMPDDLPGIILRPGEGVSVDNPVGGNLTFKLRGTETNGSLMALETIAAPGEGPPLHTHANEDEFLYVLDGRIQFRLEDELTEGPAGTCMYVRRGVPHTWRNVGDAPARMLALFTPAGMEAFFERFAEHARQVSAPEAFRRLGVESGMAVVGPPLGGVG
jgi:quercetin dioxygenase-like cupin family protein